MEEEKKLSEEEVQNDSPKEQIPKFRGLYRYVHISVKALDTIIIICIAVIILVTAFSLKDRGYMVSFDSRGGSDVAAVKYQYGDYIEPPVEPTREGYQFVGWFIDPGCQEPWLIEENTVSGAITLYAGWEKTS